jgi:hypothetical protein
LPLPQVSGRKGEGRGVGDHEADDEEEGFDQHHEWGDVMNVRDGDKECRWIDQLSLLYGSVVGEGRRVKEGEDWISKVSIYTHTYTFIESKGSSTRRSSGTNTMIIDR